MSKSANLTLQARCKSLGFDPGVLDGVIGAKTRKAHAEALASQTRKGLPFIHASGLSRIHLHWTAGTLVISRDDRLHYHELVQGDGSYVELHPLNKALSHTLNFNTGAYGMGMCGMHEAKDHPFSVGKYPLTSVQVEAFCKRVAVKCKMLDIPVSPYSVVTHAEIQPTFGVTQKGKIDIMWLPGMGRMGGPREVGDVLRKTIQGFLQ